MKLFATLDRPIKELSTQELRQYFPEGTRKVKDKKTGKYKDVSLFSNAYLMRTIIMNEKEFMTVNYQRTLRGFWYSTVKPTLDKLGLLTEKDQTDKGLTEWDNTLSRYVANLLRKGYLTYADLNIFDTSRQKQNPQESYYTVSNRTYSYKGSITPYPNILIATEKDTVYNIIAQLAALFGCTCISCKGQNALGAMEYIVKGMFSKWRNYPDFDTIYILTMTDYDPAGYYIAGALQSQCKDILNAIGRGYIDVVIKRIGITPNQLPKSLVQANKYTPKPANMDKWMQITNGINGERKGLELDALEPDQIRAIFVKEMRNYIDENIYKDFLKRSYLKMKMLEFAQDKMNEIFTDIKGEVIDKIELKDFDIFNLAKKGSASLPVSELCENTFDEQIKALTLDCFA